MDKGTVPFACRLRLIPLARREAACAEIRKMDEEGIWEPVGAFEWAHPLVTVGKKDGGVRVTTDLTRLNIGVIPDRHPLPRIGEIFHNLASSKVFSKLDITKGYWHIPLHLDSQHLTTTITPLGLRRYLRLPMGLKNAASAFQKRIQQTLLGVQGVEVYIDDVIIHWKDQKEHDEALQSTLTALQGAGFRLNMDKCAFGKSQVKAFGHLVGATGIKLDPGNIAAIKQIPVPLNAADVISFLGAVNFFSDSIPDMASLSEPLRRLTRGGEPFQWGPDQATAFSTLKAEVERATLRQGFDPGRKTYVTTDASDVGIGGVLSQANEQGEEVVIAFYSKTLDKAQRNYAANEREALACMLAIEHWEPSTPGPPLHLAHRPSSPGDNFEEPQDTERVIQVPKVAPATAGVRLRHSVPPGAGKQVAGLPQSVAGTGGFSPSQGHHSGSSQGCIQGRSLRRGAGGHSTSRDMGAVEERESSEQDLLRSTPAAAHLSRRIRHERTQDLGARDGTTETDLAGSPPKATRASWGPRPPFDGPTGAPEWAEKSRSGSDGVRGASEAASPNLWVTSSRLPPSQDPSHPELSTGWI